MNKVFRIIWSSVKDKWIVVSEKATAKGCPIFTVGALSFGALVATLSPAFALDPGALPTGGQITSGTATIATSGAQMTINQSTQQLIANWSTFNIGQDAAVRFEQPDVSSSALNRISDQNPSQIMGSLSATGKVMLVNPSGILFGKTARVDVGGLVASSLDMLDSDFLDGKYRFVNSGSAGDVINQGVITTSQQGVVAMIAPKVINEGTITAEGGSVVLAAGNKLSVDFTGDGLISYTVDQGAVDALVENQGLVKADGGMVVMTAKAADALTSSVVNNSGVIEANTLLQKGGRIILDAEEGQTTVSGTLDASSTDAKGGTVIATGTRVLVTDGAHLTASGATGGGKVLVGGSWQNRDSSVHQATGTIVEQGALLEANATDAGNGGTVVAWSDVNNPDSVTRAYGTFEAKGGPNGGNGGRIETSGHWMDVDGSQGGASATDGKPGVWLFDPADVIIQNTNSNGTWSGANPDVWSPTTGSSSSQIRASNITSRLENGTNVTITTTSTGSGNGDITVNSAITQSKSYYSPTLTLTADGNIHINASLGSINSSNDRTLNIVLNSGGYIDGSTSGIIQGGGTTIFNVGSGSGTFAGVIKNNNRTFGAFSRSVTKSGAGTLNLSATNTYTGLTTISAGTLTIGGSGSLGSGNYANDITNSGSFVYNSSANQTLSGVITGTGSLTMLGPGTLTLSNAFGTNSYSGGTTISGGTLALGANGQLYNYSSVTINGGTLAIGGFSESVGDLTLTSGAITGTPGTGYLKTNSANFIVNNTSDVSISANLDSAYGLIKSGSGTLTLSGDNTYTGGTGINGGKVSLASSGALGSSGTISFGGGTLQYSSSNTTDYSNRFSSAASQAYSIDTNAQSVTFANSLTSSGGSLTKLGAGTLTLSGANTYDGGSNLNAGTLSLGSGGALGSSGTISFGGGTLQYSSANTTDYSNRFSSAASQAYSIDTNAQSVTFANSLTSSGGTLTKLGEGTLTLGAVNTYTGSTNINAGTLKLGTSAFSGLNSALGSTSGGTTVVNGAALDLNGYNLRTAEPLTLNGTGISGGGALLNSGGPGAEYLGNITLGSDSSIVANAGYFNIGSTAANTISLAGHVLTLGGTAAGNQGYNGIVISTIQGSGSLIKSGTGTWCVMDNAYNGATQINGGKLNISSSTSLGASGTISFGGGTLQYSSLPSNTYDFSSRFSTGSNQAYSIETSHYSVTFASNLTSNGGSLTKLGTGSLILTGTNTYTGTTTVNGGTLQVGNGGATGTLGSGAVTSNATLLFKRSGDVSLSSLVSNTGVIGGTGNVNAEIGGNFTVDRTITLTGSDSSISLAAGVNVAAGTSTGGDVTLSNNITTSSTGTLSIYQGNPNTTNLSSKMFGADGATRYKHYNVAYGSSPAKQTGTRNFYYRKSASNLTVSGVTATKTFDGFVSAMGATFSGGSVSGANDDDSIVMSDLTLASATFGGAHAGTRSLSASYTLKPLTSAGWCISGYSVNNYTGSSAGTITAKAVTVGGTIDASNKTFDGYVVASGSTLTAGTPSGLISTDTAAGTLSGYTLAFSSAHAASGLTVSASGSTAGLGSITGAGGDGTS
ncbi:MAG: filamentous hemagglutinin N-terminal domain-containing protein, partial [Chlorobiaceae bacterium]|nr:filamentous hemagglutinin N-terminal domain-containing protein [Chlorobiaceae bacterium]